MVRFYIEANYMNGSRYADSFCDITEVIATLRDIEVQEGYYAPGETMPDNQKINIDTICVFTEDQDTGKLSTELMV